MPDEFPQPFGRYQLIERLAVGGMAELFVAKVPGEHGFEKHVVIKRLLPHMAATPHYNTMFIDEAKLTARLVHPKIVQTYELGSFNDQLYMSMEYVDGIDALALLRELAHRRERLLPQVAVYIVHELLDALDFAHNQVDAEGEPLRIVHRDISPSNVILSRRGDVKLVDFGIARASDSRHQTKTGTLKGKYGYMSPEQVIGDPIDQRSDLFSVGVVMAELLTGRRLFAAPNELDVLLMVRDAKLHRLERFGSHLPADLLALVHRALSKPLAKRFQTAEEFRDALGAWLHENGHRVTIRDVRDVVGALYDDARERKRRALSAPEGVSPGGAGPVPTRPAQIDGIPSGELGPGDSMPMISIEDSGPSEPPEEPRRGLSLELPQQLSGADEAAFSLDIELDSEPGPPAEVPPSLSIPEPISLDQEMSIRYPSIEEALNAMAPQSLDPSAVEFDDVPLSDVAEARTRSRDIELPVEIDPSKKPSAPRLDAVEGTPDDQGDLAMVPPITVLYRLTHARRTGLLIVRAGAVEKQIYYRDGTPEYVSSNVAKELFGEYLVAKKRISEGELAMALAMMPHYGGKLGDTLVGLGLMRPLQVFRMLTHQVRYKLVDVCTWSRGSFAWYDGRENPREAFPLDLDPYEVLGAGATQIPAEAVERWVKIHADSRPRSGKIHEVMPEHFRIGEICRRVYNQLTGKLSVFELSERYTDEAKRLEFLRVLILLALTDLALL